MHWKGITETGQQVGGDHAGGAQSATSLPSCQYFRGFCNHLCCVIITKDITAALVTSEILKFVSAFVFQANEIYYITMLH